jgi:putative solute:sodium symporter small subunit
VAHQPTRDDASDAPKKAAEAICRYFWQRTRKLTIIEFVVWLLFNVAIVWFAEPLSRWTWRGIPLSFLMISFFSLILFTVLATTYALLVNRWARSARAQLSALALPANGHGG